MTTGRQRHKRTLDLFKIAISLIGLLIILLTQDVKEGIRLLLNMEWLPFGAALLLLLSGALVRAYRWGCLVWALGGHIRWQRLVELYFVGSFFSQFLPTGVGGDAVKMYELSRDDRKAAAISSVLVDRFLGLFVLFALALLALLWGYQWVEPQERLVIALVFVGSLIGVGLLWQRTWLEAIGRGLGINHLLGRVGLLRELYESLHLYGPTALLKATTASIAWNLILVVGYYLLGLAVGIALEPWYYFLFVPLISAALLIPSVGGLGIREGITVILFSQVGVPESQALALSLAYLTVLWIHALIGAALYFTQGLREARRRQ